MTFITNDLQAARAVLRDRFRRVIISAGYTNPEPILDEHFDRYMENVPEFVKMLEEYEHADGDPA